MIHKMHIIVPSNPCELEDVKALCLPPNVPYDIRVSARMRLFLLELENMTRIFACTECVFSRRLNVFGMIALGGNDEYIERAFM